MKQKLLFALLALMTGWGSANAQTDVTTQYITNADFEGTYSSFQQPKSDRDIYQPEGWTVTYTGGESNDLTSLNSNCTQWNQFSGRQQPTNGGNNTYWIRYRWGSSAHITLSQETTTIPAGTYRLSFDAFNTNTASAAATVTVAGKSIEVNNRNTWANYGVVFSLQEASAVTITFSYKQTAGGECVAGIDNFKLIDLTQGTSDITTQDWTTALANAGFERGTNGTYGSGQGTVNVPYGFTMSAVMEGWRDGSINTTNPSEGSKLYNFWAGTTTSLDMYQMLMLPAGKYTISADLRSQDGKITDQGVYAKIGDNTYKSGTITTIGDPWNGADAWNTLSKDFYVDTEGSVQLGASSTGGANSVGWFQIDNFKLTYKGAVQNTPYTITPETATEVGANKWYAVNISADGEYRIVSSAANTVMYTQRGALVPSDVTDNLTFTANETKVINLNKGTLYLVATNDATLTVAPNSYSYSMGTPTTSVADNDYTQDNVLTVTYADAVTNDPSGAISVLDENKIKVNGTKATASLSGNVLTITLTETLATSTDYVVSIEAGALGYNVDNTNGAFTFTVKTPALFDGMYFIATADGKYISRGGDSNTEAALDNFGIAANFTTDEKNVTRIAFVDNNKNLFGGSSSVYTDKNEADLGNNAGRARWTLAAVAGGGYTLYSNQWSKYIAAGTGAESGAAAAVYSDDAYTWTLEATTEHPAKMTALKNANAENAATAAGITANTPAALNAIIEDANTYKATSITLSNNYSTIGEQYQGYGNVIPKQTINGLANGLYKVTLYGFHRITNNANTYNYSLVGADNPTAYIYANDEKVQMLSPMSQSSTTAYEGGWDPNYSPVEGKNYPNNQDAAGTAYNGGMYKNEVFVYVSDGTLEIGVYSPANYKNANWISYRDLSVTSYKSYKSSWEDALAAAQAAIANTDYENVTGSEKTALQTEIDKAEPTTAAGYSEAIDALTTATNAFINAKDSYDGLVAARTTGATYTTTDWPRAATAKKTALDDAIAADNPTNAEDAVAKTNAIVTAYRQFVESNGLAEGVATAVDKTSLLLVSDANVSTDGWTDGSIGTNQGQAYTMGDGNKPAIYFDGGWSGSAGVDITLTQELALPAGQYQLQITARGSANLTSYTMSVGATSVDLPHIGGSDGTFGNGWSDKFITFESDGTTQTLTIAATSTESQQWISFNRLRLVKLDATLADATDYSNLNTAIAAAEANLGFEDGEYAPYANTEAMALLLAAKAIDQTVNNVQEDVQAATTALNNATWTANTGEVNAVFNGTFNSEVEGDWGLTGWTRTNNWGQQRTGIEGEYATAYYNQPGSLKYGETGVYIMPLKANTTYLLRFAYRSHENNSNHGVTVSVLNGEDGISGVTVPENGSTSEWKKAAIGFTTGAAGNYVLTLNNSGNTWMTGVEIFKAQPASITIKAGRQYTGFSCDKPLDFTESELTAFIVTSATGTTQTVTKVPANTGVIVGLADVTTTQQVISVPVCAGTTDDVTDNMLVAVVTETHIDQTDGDNTNYVFGKQNEKERFFKVNGTDGITVPDNNTYLQVPTSLAKNLNVIEFGGDEATGINALETEALNGAIYNLQGQKVNRAQKGVYIVNGRKVVVK